MDKKFIFITVSGVISSLGIGFLAGWKISKNKVRRKYEDMADREIETMRKHYAAKCNEAMDSLYKSKICEPVEQDETKILDVKVDISNYGKAFEKTEEPVSPVNEKKVVNPNGKIYIITPEEFGAIPDYSAESLSYFEDDILTDEDLNEISNIEGIIGNDALDRFGEFVDDVVYVRNEKIKTDYEVVYEGHPLYADIPDDEEEGDYDDE